MSMATLEKSQQYTNNPGSLKYIKCLSNISTCFYILWTNGKCFLFLKYINILGICIDYTKLHIKKKKNYIDQGILLGTKTLIEFTSLHPGIEWRISRTSRLPFAARFKSSKRDLVICLFHVFHVKSLI